MRVILVPRRAWARGWIAIGVSEKGLFMSQVMTISPPRRTMADVLEQLGDVPLRRVLADPPPGTATEQDVIEVEAREKRLCELVDGVLVEKPMGFYESRVATVLSHFLEDFLDRHDL